MITSSPITATPVRAACTTDLSRHSQLHGAIPWDRKDLLNEIEVSGLTGRGGAAFPAWRKLAVVAKGSRPVVVANGAEGEPASVKDRMLLAHGPHLVLDGLQIAAHIVGAEHLIVYCREPQGIRRAIAQRGDWDRFPVEVVESPDSFTAGQETALVSHLETGKAKPRDRRLLVAESGVNGRPTLVHNVETLAHIALIARRGGSWFRQQGTPQDPGTFLATLSGALRAPGVYEAPHGISLGELLDIGGGLSESLSAILVGGYHGAWLPGDATEVEFSRAGLSPYGAAPGAGVLIALPVSRCGLVESARILHYLADQSTRQCGPCLNGLPAIAAGVAGVAGIAGIAGIARGGSGPNAVGQLARLAELVDGRGACRHPDGTARFLRSVLRQFSAEIRLHEAGGCSAARYREAE